MEIRGLEVRTLLYIYDGEVVARETHLMMMHIYIYIYAYSRFLFFNLKLRILDLPPVAMMMMMHRAVFFGIFLQQLSEYISRRGFYLLRMYLYIFTREHLFRPCE